MKVKIIDEKNKYFGREFKVSSLNYDRVKIKDEENLVCLNTKEVMLIPENTIESNIVNCKDLLKIKLDRYIPFLFYTLIFEFLKEKYSENIETIEVFRDSFNISRSGVWEKSLTLFVNKKFPLVVKVYARKFSKNLSFSMEDIDKENFILQCNNEICKLEHEIEEKKKSCKAYKSAIKNIKDAQHKLVDKKVM